MGRRGYRATKTYHKVGNPNDDNATMYVHGNMFTVELRIDGFQGAKRMSEHEVNINASTIIGTGQNTAGITLATW